MAPRLASVCSTWATAVADTPELWRTLDTQYLSASTAGASAAVGPSSRGETAGQKRKKGSSSRASPAKSKAAGHAAVVAGLKHWVLQGRLQKLQDLRVACVGSSHLSLEDPQFFADEGAGGAAAGGKLGVVLARNHLVYAAVVPLWWCLQELCIDGVSMCTPVSWMAVSLRRRCLLT